MAYSEQNIEDAFLAYRSTRDPAALAAVYDGTSSRLLAVALHLSASANLAEDAVQDTFLFALQHPERWDETRPLVPWLLGILANRVRQGAYKARRTPDPERLAMPDAPDPQTELQASEMLARIEEAITHLPQPYRTVVLLRLRNGLSPADIAVALDRKPSTVRAQLTRGVEMLRKVLPAGLAALLVGSATAARGLNATREVVLARAGELHRALLAQHRSMLLRTWTTGVAGVAVVAAAVWWFAVGMVAPVAPILPVADDLALIAEVEPVVREERLALPDEARAPTPEREPAAGSGVVVVTVARPDLALAGAAVELLPLGTPPRALVHYTTTARGSWREIVPIDPAAGSLRRTGRTGRDGVCTFERLPVGHWVCRSLGVCEVVEVRGGVRAEVEIEVDAGCRVVRGVVLDGGRRPVEGARIWTSQADRGRFAADSQRTGPGGRFELVVAPWTTVGASADGYAPVAAAIVASEQGPPVELTLMLEERGAGLRGVVVDADGRPVPGAEVGVGHLLDGAGPPVTTPEVAPRPERVRADAEGRFTLPSLVAGEALVHARGAGFGAVVQVVGLEAGAELEVRLELPREAVVTGVVRDVRGAPVADATVHVARGDQANARRTSTDARGRYRLDGVTPGRALVEVTDYRGGFATKVLDLEVGGAATWDVQLADGELQLTGNVVTADDRPLAYGWVVHVTPSGQRVHQLDRGGAFVVPASERDAAVASPLLVFDQDPRDHLGHVWGVPRAIVNDLRVEDGHATIRLADEPRASWLRGRVVDREGRAPNEVVVLRASDGARSWRLRLDPLAADGAFDVGPLPKGRYHVNLASNSLRSFGPFEVAEGQSLDLGTLQVAAATPRHAVRLGLVFPAGEAGFEPVDVEVRSLDDGFVLRHYHAAGGRESDPMVWLPVGRHRVVARTASGLVAERALDVVGDARTGRLPLLRFERR